MGTDIETLWKDTGIQETFKLRDKEFQLNDSAAYFFDNIHRFKEDSYVPTQDDVLRARVRSTGIEEAEFEFSDMCFRCESPSPSPLPLPLPRVTSELIRMQYAGRRRTTQ